jgi:hypothetical protein
MSKYFCTFKLKDYLSLMSVLIIGAIWLMIDQFFIDLVYQRFVALILIFILLLFFQYLINTPTWVFRYAGTISIICITLSILLSVIIHVIILHNFTYKSVLIWVASAAAPFISAVLYTLLVKAGKAG